jgi:DNA-binding NarL/FixJ family response regulator
LCATTSPGDVGSLPEFIAAGTGWAMGKKCMILADSHAEVLLGIRNLLRSLFDAILMVADEGSLLVAVEKSRPDLVVVDLSLHVDREANVARRIKKSFPETKFIVLSVYDEPTVVRECLEAGAVAFVLKRSAVDDLIPAVEAALRGEMYVSPSVQA